MTCPLCATDAPLIQMPVSGRPDGASAAVCAICVDQIGGTPEVDHLRALPSTMWSEDPAIQVLAARLLTALSHEGWAQDAADQLYLDDETRAWADNVVAKTDHADAHGAALSTGDTVVLIKDLPVKGAGFTAKRGTAVRGISLVPDNPAQIEGRVSGQRIVILTDFVKRKR
ncbi:MAG: alkylphosphonate utilization protein [Paracoccaceae bacterium]|nr:alkylphosphonate utilization protein [Paracoccaceae bacterium]MDG2452669.1 alkylphosphonate utilization protein [Paracoccaceae bacterium]